jgi:hypothetical protein
MAIELEDEDRQGLEDAIEDATHAAERYLTSEKQIHKKLLEVTVDDALHALSLYKDLLVDDPKKETYKIHLLVPVQIIEMLKEKDENTKG